MKEQEVLKWIMPLIEENYSDNPIKYKNQIFLLKEKNFKFSENYKNKIEILFLNYNFINGIMDLRITFKIPNNGFKKYEDCIKWAEKFNGIDLGKYKKNLYDLLKNNLVSERWAKFIESYLLFNKKILYLIPKPIDFTLYKNENEVTIKIQKDATLLDVKTFWKNIEELQDMIYADKNKEYEEYITIDNGKAITKSLSKNKKVYKFKSLEKYKEMFDMKESGSSLEDIAEKFFNFRSDSTKVSSCISKYNKAIKENILY